MLQFQWPTCPTDFFKLIAKKGHTILQQWVSYGKSMVMHPYKTNKKTPPKVKVSLFSRWLSLSFIRQWSLVPHYGSFQVLWDCSYILVRIQSTSGLVTKGLLLSQCKQLCCHVNPRFWVFWWKVVMFIVSEHGSESMKDGFPPLCGEV